MTHVSIIGSGNMGQAISSVVAKGGNTVELFNSTDKDQDITGEVVILATPYPAFEQVLAERADQLAGKVVVDISNPLNFETFDSLTVPADGSAAAELAAKLPDSKVLKAFNTNFAATVGAGKAGDALTAVPTTVLIAGDDADAKALLAGIVSAGGLRAVDAGSLKRARELEAVGFLQLTLAVGEKIAWTGGFGLV